MKNINLLIIIMILLLPSCATYKGEDNEYTPKPKREENIGILKPEINTTQSVVITGDNSYPITSTELAKNPSRTVTLNEIGQKLKVKTGEVVNFIYDGIDPEEIYILYESTDDGYNLELNYKTSPINIIFKRMCHSFIVASPNLTSITVPHELKFEQIIWTPREDGTWEVRIGTMERGCASPALQNLNKLRTKKYENSIPKK